ncbi:shikimate kinase [Synechocystis sp. PCC 7509]|uniref:shikimate kinase n=1 Tax=Synechocystis sp. PCC 7509 TaxID=927677 RepID=UPI0002ACA61B|nr:shikimate kinase [Synechocystis sp. PCC 7509]
MRITTASNLLKGVNLYLIGMMGSGKTTIGSLIATELGYGFVDTDAVIEQVTKHSISQLFAEVGEAEFRQIESQVLAEVCAYTNLVVSTGGGIVTQQKNWSYLHYGLIVWLDVPIKVLYERLKEDNTRPLLQAADPLGKLQSIFEQRQPLYNQADLHIRVSEEETASQIANRVIALIPSVLKQNLSPPN